MSIQHSLLQIENAIISSLRLALPRTTIDNDHFAHSQLCLDSMTTITRHLWKKVIKISHKNNRTLDGMMKMVSRMDHSSKRKFIGKFNFRGFSLRVVKVN